MLARTSGRRRSGGLRPGVEGGQCVVPAGAVRQGATPSGATSVRAASAGRSAAGRSAVGCAIRRASGAGVSARTSHPYHDGPVRSRYALVTVVSVTQLVDRDPVVDADELITGWCHRRGSATRGSPPTGRRRPAQPAGGGHRAVRVRRAGRQAAAEGPVPAVRAGGRGLLPGRRVRRRQDAPAGLAVARGARPEGVRHLRGVHPPGRGARVRRDGAPAVRAQAGRGRRVRAGRPGRHHADDPAAGPAVRRRGLAGGDVQHAAGQAGRGAVRRRGLPPRDPRPVRPVRHAAGRRPGLPARRAGPGAAADWPRPTSSPPPPRRGPAWTRSRR